MKAKILTASLFLIYLTASLNAQQLTLKTLMNCYNSNDIGKVENIMSTNNFSYLDENYYINSPYLQVKQIRWTYGLNAQKKTADAFFFLRYSLDSLGNKKFFSADYQCKNKVYLDKIKIELTAGGYKMTKSDIEDGNLIQYYDNGKYSVEIIKYAKDASGEEVIDIGFSKKPE